ncbi:MAG: membrane protein insertion efficiency factor YidD [Candidatus Omnitrophica bacterium]|nr:membrane protein insertion efficiency factor YidD [Candidatus Omnitrophota bacterium]
MKLFIKNLLIFLIKIYRNLLSPFKLQSCRFYPSCSEYAIESIDKYGIFKGITKAIMRISKCHPFHKGGFDPA